MPPPTERLLIALATYNERDNLASLVHEILKSAPAADVLITDDNSPDGTGRLADELAAADPRVHVVHRTGKLGLGSAILAAMHYAIDHKFDCVTTMDADFSHHPRYLPAMNAAMKDHDIVIGSRYVAGGGTLNWPWSRRLTSKSVNVLVRLLLRMPVRDASGGYRCYSVPLLRRSDLASIRSRGYSFQEEVLFRCYQAGARLGETPIIFEDRRAGASKVNRWEMIRSLAVILCLGISATFAGRATSQTPKQFTD